MTYNKPEVVMLGDASTLVQGSKSRGIDPDGVATPGAVPLELYGLAGCGKGAFGASRTSTSDLNPALIRRASRGPEGLLFHEDAKTQKFFRSLDLTFGLHRSDGFSPKKPTWH